QQLRQRLLPMFLPYDIALERGWSHGVPVFVSRPFLVSEADEGTTTIGGRSVYKATKLPLPMRIPAAFFRARDYAKRFLSALKRPALSRGPRGYRSLPCGAWRAAPSGAEWSRRHSCRPATARARIRKTAEIR